MTGRDGQVIRLGNQVTGQVICAGGQVTGREISGTAAGLGVAAFDCAGEYLYPLDISAEA